MKKLLTAACCGLLLLSLAACGGEDPYRVDTVVRIPVDPTEATEMPETEAPTQPEETEPTEAPPTEAPKTSGNKTGGGKKPSGGKQPSNSGDKATEPPQTQPPTEPPATQPPTEPTAAEPAQTQPPAETQPPVTEPEATVPETQPPYDPSSYAVGSLEYAILAEINAHRTEAGLPELTLSTRLCGIAAIRGEEVSRVWSHNRPDGRYYTSVLADYGYGYSTAGENLCYVTGSGDAASIVSKWMGGDNRESLLSGSFTTAGIGVYRSGGVTYVVNILIG